jgi:thiol-disulfide isomerase/thioredoxin
MATILSAQTGYDIQVKIDHYEQDTLFLGFYYGEKQYLKDTAVLKNGRYHFKNTEPLKPGSYLLILPPDNQFVQLHINKNNQKLDLRFDATDPVQTIDAKGDPDNTAFYAYVRYLSELRPRADEIRKQIEDAPDEVKQILEQRLQELNQEVTAFQKKIVADNPGTITALLVNNFIERPLPDFSDIEDPKERQLKQYRYFMDHYFDGMQWDDESLIRTSFFYQKVHDYVTKHTIQVPDTINKALDYVLTRMQGNEDAFKFFLVHFVNHFAKSQIIGMDAVYVHLVDNYYDKGAAPWIDEEQLEKMRKNAASLRPILIGKIAPDIRMTRRDGSKIALHEIESPYTVLMFWSPDCGHCKKAMPKVLEFFEAFKDKGVFMFSVCTKLTDKVDECWKMIDEKGMDVFLNVVDPYHQSRFSLLYDVKTTPQIFILDEKKEIIMKRISTEQLPEVMEELLDRKRRMMEEPK